MKLKQDAENEIEAFRQTKAENEKELVVVQEELQQKKQIAGNTEVLLTADNLQQYVKKIEVDHKKILTRNLCSNEKGGQTMKEKSMMPGQEWNMFGG